jgi:hypothetical protein
MWKYEVANTDHSLMQGVELINRLLLGERETTIGMVYKVTEDGRNAANHERPAHAGSGEKRLIGAPALRPGSSSVEPKSNPATSDVGDIAAGEVGEEEVGVTTHK